MSLLSQPSTSPYIQLLVSRTYLVVFLVPRHGVRVHDVFAATRSFRWTLLRVGVMLTAPVMTYKQETLLWPDWSAHKPRLLTGLLLPVLVVLHKPLQDPAVNPCLTLVTHKPRLLTGLLLPVLVVLHKPPQDPAVNPCLTLVTHKPRLLTRLLLPVLVVLHKPLQDTAVNPCLTLVTHSCQLQI